MDATLAGLIGAFGGVIVPKAWDFLNDRRQRRREDEVWRRQHVLDAAASFLMAANRADIGTRALVACQETLRQMADSEETDPAADPFGSGLRQDLDAAVALQRSALEDASQALSRMGILLSHTTCEVANRYLSGIIGAPGNLHNSVLASELTDLIRSELGLPTLVIAEGDRLTVAEFEARVAEMGRTERTS